MKIKSYKPWPLLCIFLLGTETLMAMQEQDAPPSKIPVKNTDKTFEKSKSQKKSSLTKKKEYPELPDLTDLEALEKYLKPSTQ